MSAQFAVTHCDVHNARDELIGVGCVPADAERFAAALNGQYRRAEIAECERDELRHLLSGASESGEVVDARDAALDAVASITIGITAGQFHDARYRALHAVRVLAGMTESARAERDAVKAESDKWFGEASSERDARIECERAVKDHVHDIRRLTAERDAARGHACNLAADRVDPLDVLVELDGPATSAEVAATRDRALEHAGELYSLTGAEHESDAERHVAGADAAIRELAALASCVPAEPDDALVAAARAVLDARPVLGEPHDGGREFVHALAALRDALPAETDSLPACGMCGGTPERIPDVIAGGGRGYYVQCSQCPIRTQPRDTAEAADEVWRVAMTPQSDER